MNLLWDVVWQMDFLLVSLPPADRDDADICPHFETSRSKILVGKKMSGIDEPWKCLGTKLRNRGCVNFALQRPELELVRRTDFPSKIRSKVVIKASLSKLGFLHTIIIGMRAPTRVTAGRARRCTCASGPVALFSAFLFATRRSSWSIRSC